jgi:hypothetical protein
MLNTIANPNPNPNTPGPMKSPIWRGNELLGYILLTADIDIIAENMNITNEADNTIVNFINNSKPPTDAEVREMYPEINQPLGNSSSSLMYNPSTNRLSNYNPNPD